MLKQRNIGILLFNEVEVLDFAGPFEVFSITAWPESNEKPFVVKTVAQTKEVIVARNGLKILPDYDFNNSPQFDILIIPGGYGAEMIELHNEILLNWIKEKSKDTSIIASVCTGAFLLAEAGLLDGRQATTHWMDVDRLMREYSKIKVKRDVRFIDETTILTSGGISSGINMSLYLVGKLLGEEIARTTAKRMEYEYEL